MKQQGTPVALLLPGMGLNSSIFPDLGIATIAPDWSTVPLGADGTGIGTGATRMRAYQTALDDRLSLSREWETGHRIVVAHSFGGMLALDWLLSHDSRGLARIDGLVLIATTAGPMYESVRVRLARIGDHELRLGISKLMPFWNLPVTTRTVKRLFCRGTLATSPVDFGALPSSSDLAIDLGVWRNTDWRAMRSFRLAMRGFDVRKRLGKIDARTVVLHGTHDPLFAKSVAEDLANGIRGAELRLVPGAGHGLPLSHPAEVMRAVRDASTFDIP